MITYMMARLGHLRNERGASAVEYSLIVSFIAILIIAAVTGVGNQLVTMFNNILTKLGGTP